MADAVKTEPFASVYVLDSHFQYKDLGVVSVFNSPAGRAVMTGNHSPLHKKASNHRQTQPIPPKRPSAELSKFVLDPKSLIDKQNNSENIQIKNGFSEIEYSNIYPDDDRSNINSRLVVDVNNSNIFYSNGNTAQDGVLSTADSVKKLGMDFRDEAVLTRRLVNRRNMDFVTYGDRDQNAVDRSQFINTEDVKRQDGDMARCDNRLSRRYVSSGDVLKGQCSAGARLSADAKCDLVRRLLGGLLGGWAARRRGAAPGVGVGVGEQLCREAELALGIPCQMTDECRCLDCQCHYFDCGESDSDTSDISMSLFDCENEDWASMERPRSSPIYLPEEPQHCCTENQPKNDSAIANLQQNLESDKESADAVPPSCPECDSCGVGKAGLEEELTPSSVEMAAGTPVILDNLLNNPVTCSIQ